MMMRSRITAFMLLLSLLSVVPFLFANNPNPLFASLHLAHPDPRVAIMHLPVLSPSCKGNFSLSITSNLTADIIDVVFDTRPAIRNLFKRRHPNIWNFRHVLLHVSMRIGSRLLSFTSANVEKPQTIPTTTVTLHPPIETLRIEIDHVVLMNCQAPERRDRHIQQCEWSVSIVLWTNNTSALELDNILDQAIKGGASMLFKMPLTLTRSELEVGPGPVYTTVFPTMTLSCIASREIHRYIPWLPSAKDSLETCKSSNSAMLMLGPALYASRRNLRGVNEAAHFVFRALHGQISFDTVMIGIQAKEGFESMSVRCTTAFGMNHTCFQSLQKANNDDMTRLVQALDAELRRLGVRREKRRRVVVIPACRISGANPCDELRASGQVLWGEAVAAQLAFSHKWIGALDLDELMGPPLRGSITRFGPKRYRAVDILDSAARKSRRVVLKFAWVYAHLEHDASPENLSRAIAEDGTLELDVRYADGSLAPELSVKDTCRFVKGKGSMGVEGKGFGRCEVLLSSQVHFAVVQNGTAGSAELGAHDTISKDVRVWHARLSVKRRQEARCMLRIVTGKTTSPM